MHELKYLRRFELNTKEAMWRGVGLPSTIVRLMRLSELVEDLASALIAWTSKDEGGADILPFRLASAFGAAVTGASLAHTVWRECAMPLQGVSLQRHADSFGLLLEHLNALPGSGYGRALTALRAASLRPEVILGILKPLCCHPDWKAETGALIICCKRCCGRKQTPDSLQ